MIGGMFFVSGVVVMAFNVFMTVRNARIEQAELEAKIAAKLAKAGA
jgi:cytochrome c oxidase cbb3-type subunit 1